MHSYTSKGETNMIKGAFNGSARDAEELLRDGGYIIDVHFRKGGSTITLSPQLLGVDIAKNDDLKGFFDEYVENNKVSFFGKNNVWWNKTQSIAKSAHKKKIEMSLDGKSYMTPTILREYKVFLDEKKGEFFAARDELVNEYENAVLEFRHKLENKLLSNTLSGLTWDERQDIIGRVMRRIPSKEKFYKSFKVELSHTKFALSGEVVEEFQEDVLDETVDRVYDITGRTLAVIFSKMNKIYGYIDKNGSITKTYREMLVETAQDITNRNVFDNHILENIREDMLAMEGLDADTIADLCETAISSVYCYADEIGMVDALDMDEAKLSVPDMELFGRSRYQTRLLGHAYAV